MSKSTRCNVYFSPYISVFQVVILLKKGGINMADILHRIGIKTSSIEAVYQALTTKAGLAGWWTSNTNGEGNKVGNVIEFRFGAGGFDIKVTGLNPSDHVLWEVVDGPEEWIGTTISFNLKQDGDYIIVLFKHLDWKEPVEFMHHCSTKWAIFLMSLKALIEIGKGTPDPIDVKIDNWN
jgi:hypothetical protein